MTFIHLDTFSAYSLLESMIMPDELVQEAKKRGYRTVALADKNVLYGVIPFYKACLKHNVKPIIGLNVDVLTESGEAHPFILIAKTYLGYQNLIKISSAIQTKSLAGIPLNWLVRLRKDLFVISFFGLGEIDELLLEGEMESALEKAKEYQTLFDENAFFLSIRPNTDEGKKGLIDQILQISIDTGIPVVPVEPVRFLNKDDYYAWKCLLAIKKNIPIGDIQTEPHSKEYYLKSEREMKSLLQTYPEVLKNLENMVDQCEVRFSFHQRFIPKYPVPYGSSDEYLKELCEKGLRGRIADPQDVYWKRLSYELDVIKRMNFSDYFLIVWDFVRYAKEKGIIVGPGRGSAAGSLVAFVLGITDVDPIKYDLLFERFLNPERVSMPDIDIDFPDHRRDEIIRYVVQKYGENQVAQIITFGTFAAKAALRDVARMFQFSNQELGQLSKAVPSKLGITLDEALKESPALQKLVQHDKYRQIFQIAKKIEGLPRHTSTHAAGVIISDRSLLDIVPLQKGSTDTLLTQYPMGVLEELGLLKMDFLGLRNLSLMEHILKDIEKTKGKTIRLKDIPFDDQQTFLLLQEGKTTGVFQLESEGMRNVLKKLKPSEFEDIVAVNALYRPGPMSNIPLYIDRKHGRERVVYPHPDLENILKKTYGVIVYQEQIMQVASKFAGFTLGEADLLRRAVSKKKRDILDHERKHFVQGALRSGYSEKVANELYDIIVHFADYGFNRSHAVAYSMISYQLAYLKAHYPLHFMAALLTSVIGNEEKIAEYIMELKQFGYAVKGPSINRSQYRFFVDHDGIRFSLAAIKGVGMQALKEIIRARKEGPFRDLFDFCLRVSLKTVNRKTMEHLIYAGAFDEFQQDRAVLLASLDAAIEHARLMKPEDRQMHLMGDGLLDFQPKYVQKEPIPIHDKLKYEKEVLGLFVSEHPVSIYRNVYYYERCKHLAELLLHERNCKVLVYISHVHKIRTKRGEAMAFLHISDESGDLQAVAFPEVYRKISGYVKNDEILLLVGYLDKRNGERQFIIQDANLAEEMQQRVKDLRLFIRVVQDEKHEKLLQLKKILKQYQGKTPVILFYERGRRTVQLPDEYWIDLRSEGVMKIKRLFGDKNVAFK
ncbi:DNA polymerase III subunit alpha [Fervidibacillus halotolerans]|uniref:DNA polymerase III subunit alpha n=1 Tax=Fervidibacillus halotolerans TaxID=2980027 RepID=A0A9E8RWE6_9BACI|nr:DNA polymerase III subunit alpha [Fervidibacillus halotolerans]WAA11670.1 DNA polymerase III subunit alpha [Fervidibacillus halotolerans]